MKAVINLIKKGVAVALNGAYLLYGLYLLYFFPIYMDLIIKAVNAGDVIRYFELVLIYLIMTIPEIALVYTYRYYKRLVGITTTKI